MFEDQIYNIQFRLQFLLTLTSALLIYNKIIKTGGVGCIEYGVLLSM